ncbi:ChaB family protein [Methanosalsum zhilinae DSM 4017]|uniref:ChaB family protein n=1 Tax=Methanosalsum zhilinae (strain DSM 4017 / NBRC 107636 / OCM 62 / WeN5) TaxID=679901 RepID=F7XLJ4_METZD|nr:ChaB family protein [Methanosalsum zhilinae]AEH60813.1 ChaB family protein [Methanosalsum zhilinae DSM 4017]
MPYDKLSDLPASVRNNLPKNAQEIYMKAFNNAWNQYDDPEKRRGDKSQEEVAHSVAWSAVKEKYQKNEDGEWVKK